MRLLGIGLPLTIALGSAIAVILFGQLSVEEAVVLGVVAGADGRSAGAGGRHRPARAAAHPPGAERRERAQRRDLRPAAASWPWPPPTCEADITEGHRAITIVAEEIGYGLLGGAAAGALIAVIVVEAGRRDLIAGPWRQVIPAAGAALAYGVATGSAVLASSPRSSRACAFRMVLRRDPEELNRFSEEVGGRCSAG